MIYLGIDASYSGFAVAAYATTGTSATHVSGFPPARYGGGVDRLLAIQEWLVGILGAYQGSDGVQVGAVAMEGYASGAKFGREVAGELGAVVKMALRTHLIGAARYPTLIAPTALKKYVLGRGVGAKNEMLLGCYKKWGAEFTDDNAADAYALARIAAAIDTGVGITHDYERAVISKVRVNTEAPPEH